MTCSLDFVFKIIDLGDCIVKLKIWDTAGQERYQSLCYSTLRGCHGAFIVFAVNEECKDSIEEVGKYYEMYKDLGSFKEKSVCFVVANKIDMERVVTTEEGRSVADSYGLKYYETSAKNGTNIDKLFEDMIQSLLKSFKGVKFKSKGMNVNEKNVNPVKRKKGGCC